MGTQDDIDAHFRNEPAIHVGHEGVAVRVMASSRDWFPLYIEIGVFVTTLYLNRRELVALKERLQDIDETVPLPDGFVPTKGRA